MRTPSQSVGVAAMLYLQCHHTKPTPKGSIMKTLHSLQVAAVVTLAVIAAASFLVTNPPTPDTIVLAQVVVSAKRLPVVHQLPQVVVTAKRLNTEEKALLAAGNNVVRNS
jgi:hypothetical protein